MLNNNNKITYLLLCGLLAGVSGCGDNHEEQNKGQQAADGELTALLHSRECLAEAVKMPAANAIVNGKQQPAIPMSEGQKKAVGALMSTIAGEWTNICTATVIAPKVVLTAAHCVLKENSSSFEAEAASAFAFAVGVDVAKDAPHEEFAVKEVKWNPRYGQDEDNPSLADQAILIMQDDLTQKVAGLTPIEINFDHELAWLEWGEKMQNVGYGATGKNGKNQKNTKRFWTTEPVEEKYDGYYTVNGDNYTGVGPGDSGGPGLHLDPDGVVRVIGTVSHGDDNCVGIDEYSRIDANLDWVKKAVGQKIWGCLGLTAAGECTNNNKVARWCTNSSQDQINYENCTTKGQVCALDRDGRAACVAAGQTPEPESGTDQEHDKTDEDSINKDDCQALGWQGKCAGQVAVWCQNGQKFSRDCQKCGQSCGETATMGAYCL